MRQERSQVLLPPRPNPGPEDWPDSATTPGWRGLLAPVAGALLLLLLGGWWLGRRRRRKLVAARAEASNVPPDDSPRGQILRLAAEVRRSLSDRFGPAMRARTTEEIAADASVREALGPDRFEPLVHLLASADRWKFAPSADDDPPTSLPDEFLDWEGLATALNGGAPVRRGHSASRPPG